MQIPSKLYDRLKWLCILGLPALSTLYSGLAAIWGWALYTEIPATFSAVGMFLGAILGVSSAEYNKGLENGKENSE